MRSLISSPTATLRPLTSMRMPPSLPGVAWLGGADGSDAGGRCQGPARLVDAAAFPASLAGGQLACHESVQACPDGSDQDDRVTAEVEQLDHECSDDRTEHA